MQIARRVLNQRRREALHTYALECRTRERIKMVPCVSPVSEA
jgi:hypothetical protein